jgi:uncharacterized protein
MLNMTMNRRHALCCTGALSAGLFTSLLSGCEDGDGSTSSTSRFSNLRNPCRDALPTDPQLRDLVQQAFTGIDASRLIDSHAHLLGTGDSGSGCSVHISTTQWWHPMEMLRRRVILNAACADTGATSIDERYVQRLHQLASGFPAGARWWLFAFAKAHDDEGRERDDWTTFHVPDAYAAMIAQQHADRFDWVASIHPYAPDALQRLATAQAQGAVAIKWLPSAMNINPASPRCKPFYDALQRSGLPVIVHCGEEKAAPGAKRDDYVNPLLLRVPLDAGVRVIVAHAASLGHAQDTDKRSGPKVAAFDLFARLMDEYKSSPRLMADISAVFQRNRESTVWRALLQRQDWHSHLLHGSDYPLPGVMPLFSPKQLAAAGLLDASVVAPLLRLREHNALLFDFVLKRNLRLGSLSLPASVFEARALKNLHQG